MDKNFVQLYTNFADAKLNGDCKIVELTYKGFIQQLPNEVFLQTTNSTTPIVFAGGITIDLIDDCNNLVRNINENFAYTSFVDEKGIAQITFEFGLIGVDFYTKPLYLKITDDINGNVYYSNSFLITNYNSDYTTKIVYYNDITDMYKQSIRFANLYYHTPVNERNFKQYTTSTGNKVNYKSVTSFLKKYIFDNLNFDINNKLEFLFSSSNIYFDNQRVVLNDYKSEERVGDTNFIKGEIVVNAQNEYNVELLQILEPLGVLNFEVPNGSFYTKANFDSYVTSVLIGNFQIEFNKPIDLPIDVKIVNIRIYRDSTLIRTITTAYCFSQLMRFSIGDLADFTNGVYNVVVAPIEQLNGLENWNGISLGQWTFTIASGEFESTEFDNTEYLVSTPSPSKIFNNKFNNKFG